MRESNRWGLLGPDVIPSARRTRTLGVSNVVRAYNELAVPGLGNIWFAKQLLIALHGIRLAEKLKDSGMRVSNITAANAVEALACLLTFRETNFAPQARLCGNTKLRHNDASFSKLSSPAGYVTQPMRMTTVQPLLALGLVESDGSQLFNSYKCSELGLSFLNLSHDKTPGRSPEKRLHQWSQGSPPHQSLTDYLNPRADIDPRAAAIIRDCLARGAPRRAKILQMLRVCGTTVTLRDLENSELDRDHLDHMIDGARFSELRGAALRFLDCCEGFLRNTTDKQCDVHSSSLHASLEIERAALNRAAATYDQGASRLGSESGIAQEFAMTCSQSSSQSILRGLLLRDGTVLRLEGETVLPGPAFSYDQTPPDETVDPNDVGSAEDDLEVVWPENFSPRLQNLHNLILEIETIADQ
jgi:hypothetical protein